MCHVDVTGVHLISIHAPPRGATHRRVQCDCALPISIHAPPRGATRPRLAEHPRPVGISIPAPPQGATGQAQRRFSNRAISIPAPPRGTTEWLLVEDCEYLISIHAPPRGATIQARSPFRADHYFNSRPSARGDSTSTGKRSTISLFQFTPLREGRRR